ncbi:MAG: hypothetical protein A2513_02760 [Sulfurimonas sp. RIFOXYD12_FULL_33_39]|uniref:hypothetical protein n=1 Tax=unclassified Sulfurimonas TaxID=2623549 RepID=UPI0008ABEBFA|nr:MULTISPECIES: hypothetical protein [unclassified Sulfurimonas]OHE08922.1 MAG: hypothetical protein A2513_02760 [Sulfurimonas sp. RIFOXYD12_FULL_33_39]OHE14232.1 MAG: hypothetical protein A2530_06060 [Sulfurimonas sp. RIFOXYD2_FULL_34_21]DAB27995.1 MAG TPA: hypothetical protein CFH78_04840 [Sulfurimonas sp. UBA10385]
MEKRLKLRLVAGFTVIAVAITVYAGYLKANEEPCELVYFSKGKCACKSSLPASALKIIEEREANLAKYFEEHPEIEPIKRCQQ